LVILIYIIRNIFQIYLKILRCLSILQEIQL